MKSYRLMLSYLALALALMTGCGVDYGSGGTDGGGGTFAISTTAATFGVVGNAYSSTPATINGTAPFTWSLFGGTLPAGLALNTVSGAVTGIPTTAGNSTATLTVRDSAGKTATGSVLFAIHPRTDRVSVNNSGTAGDSASSTPSLSGDGSFVAFASQSTNFVTGVNGSQIYVHNRQTNQIELVSRDNSANVVNEGNGVSSDPTISTDGRFVAFVSQATNLLAPGTPAIPAGQQIYVRDRQTGQTSLVSVDNSVAPNAGNGFSSAPSISADGRFVAFVSLATDLLAPGVPAVAGQQIYVRDRQVNQTSLASADNNAVPNPGNGLSSAPSINGDGSLVAFDSLATNLLAPGVPSVAGRQVYVRNRTVNQTSLVSTDNNVVPNPGNGVSRTPSISSDGRFVAFVSLATNVLAPGVPAVAGQQVYSRDRQSNQTNLVSRDNTSTDVAGNDISDTPGTNSNGRFVSFFSRANNLVVGSATFSDVYVRALP